MGFFRKKRRSKGFSVKDLVTDTSFVYCNTIHQMSGSLISRINACSASKIFVIGGLEQLGDISELDVRRGFLKNSERSLDWLIKTCYKARASGKSQIIITPFPRDTFSAINARLGRQGNPGSITLNVNGGRSSYSTAFFFFGLKASSYYREVLASQECPPNMPLECVVFSGPEDPVFQRLGLDRVSGEGEYQKKSALLRDACDRLEDLHASSGDEWQTEYYGDPLTVEVEAVESITTSGSSEDDYKNNLDVLSGQLDKLLAPVTPEEFVAQALDSGLVDGDEERDFKDLPELENIDKLINSGQYEEAIESAMEGISVYPDLDLFFQRLGNAYLAMNDHKNAAIAYASGLIDSIRVSSLCEALGQLFYNEMMAGGSEALDGEAGRHAVLWWLRGCVAQLKGGRFRFHTPFMAVATIAEGISVEDPDMKGYAEQVMLWSDKANKQNLIYNPETEAIIKQLGRMDFVENGAFRDAIIKLCDRYGDGSSVEAEKQIRRSWKFWKKNGDEGKLDITGAGSESKRIRKKDAKLYFDARHLQENGDYEGAIILWKKLLQRTPEFRMAWNERGECHYKLSQFSEGCLCMDRAIELTQDPDMNKHFYVKKATMQGLNENYKSAHKTLDKAMEDNPDSAYLWQIKAAVHKWEERYDEALECLLISLKFDKGDPQAWNLKGRLEDDMHLREEAIESFERFLKLAGKEEEYAERVSYAQESMERLKWEIKKYSDR